MRTPSTSNTPIARASGAFLLLIITAIAFVIIPLEAKAKDDVQTLRSRNTEAPVNPPVASTILGAICNTAVITIPVSGASTPYPSTMQITGQSGYVTNVTVKLNGFTHDFYSDVDILLVGPGGQGVVLMSDTGSNCTGTTDLTIQDGAPPIPHDGCPQSGSTYGPTNYAPNDHFYEPAPPPNYSQNLSEFYGGTANGTWSLYVMDDTYMLGGQISGGWCLDITTNSDATPASTSTATPTSTATVTRTPTYITPPPMTSPTPTGGAVGRCYADVVQSTASCVPGDTYHYRFVMDVNDTCEAYTTFSGNIYLDAAPHVGGPWTTISQIPHQQTLPAYQHNLIEGDISEAIPQQYLWFRIRLDGITGVIQHDVSGQTEPMHICSTATATFTATIEPTATHTNIPFSSQTPTTTTPTHVSVSTATATVSPVCTPQWSVVTSPNLGSGDSYLLGVSTLPSGQAWAVGGFNRRPNSDRLIEYWDGNRWSVNNAPVENTILEDIEAVATNDVWAVGWRRGQDENKQAILHWDGMDWNLMPSPSPGANSYLMGISAVSSNDIWAVGEYEPLGADRLLLIEHWDGNQWSIVPGPDAENYGGLEGIDALSTNDVWAVGYSYTVLQPHTILLHWDGDHWSFLPFQWSGNTITITDVAAIDSNDVWAVGYYFDDSIEGDRALTLHWDGSLWSIVPNTSAGHLYGIVTLASDDVWTVGFIPTLIQHWDGIQWSTVSSPNQGELWDIAADAAGNIWVVGSTLNPDVKTLVLRYTLGCLGPTPTPIACPIEFSDVPPDSTFYEYVHCLACRDVLGGYGDGTFRPGNDVTRGQISKIVANAAGLTQEPGTQIYEDVPPSSPFYLWVQRLSLQSIMGGYPCGGEMEPCIEPDNRPYFRPNANATRGQIAKIISNAAGFNEVPVSQPFQDVPFGSAFHPYIERLYLRAIMGGYECGTRPEEPCVEPYNRPYFRWGSNATRGQTAKLVEGAFFPDCQSP